MGHQKLPLDLSRVKIYEEIQPKMIFIQMYSNAGKRQWAQYSVFCLFYYYYYYFYLHAEKSSKPLLMTTVPYIKIIYEQPPFAFLF